MLRGSIQGSKLRKKENEKKRAKYNLVVALGITELFLSLALVPAKKNSALNFMEAVL